MESIAPLCEVCGQSPAVIKVSRFSDDATVAYCLDSACLVDMWLMVGKPGFGSPAGAETKPEAKTYLMGED